MPLCTSLYTGAFKNCTALTSIDLPSCTRIGISCFSSCSNLQFVNSPVLKTVEKYALRRERSPFLWLQPGKWV
jgi:hypothetical protein